ncbi:MAG: phosphatase PAP2 family protein [Alphaproteobacteria bacterium]
MVDYCTRNCPFISGEVSGTTVTALALLLIRFHPRRRLHKTVLVLLPTAAICLPLAVVLPRLAAGRHFLPDTAASPQCAQGAVGATKAWRGADCKGRDYTA